MSAEYYHEGDGILRKRQMKKTADRYKNRKQLPEGCVGLTELRKNIVAWTQDLKERVEYDVHFHQRPLCRVILEPL